jgi:hypothetical protein
VHAYHFVLQPHNGFVDTTDVSTLLDELVLELAANALLGALRSFPEELHIAVLHTKRSAVLRDLGLHALQGIERDLWRRPRIVLAVGTMVLGGRVGMRHDWRMISRAIGQPYGALPRRWLRELHIVHWLHGRRGGRQRRIARRLLRQAMGWEDCTCSPDGRGR